MPVRRDPRQGNWYFRKQVRLPDGGYVRIFGVPTTEGLPNTKVGAIEAERREINRVLAEGGAQPKPQQKKALQEIVWAK